MYCIVLASNQVTPDIVRGSGEGSKQPLNTTDVLNDKICESSHYEVRPSLGPTWHHCVTTRLLLSERNSSESFYVAGDADDLSVRAIR
jgi:hypothetical protein